MAIPGKSLSQDTADRFALATFVSLILLATVALFLPLSPSFNLSLPREVRIPHPKAVEPPARVTYPEYKATCWCPPEFPRNFIEYTNTLCATALNVLSRGQNFSEASLYPPLDSPVPSDVSHGGKLEPFNVPQKPINTGAMSTISLLMSELRFHSRDLLRVIKDPHSGIMELASFKVPLYLFILALFLVLPYALRSFMASCCCSFNVDQTLIAVQATQSMDSASHQRLKNELSESLSKSARKSTAILYLLMKLLCVVVVCVEVAVVSQNLLADADRLDQELDAVESVASEVHTASFNLANELVSKQDQKPTEPDLSPSALYSNRVLNCNFKITKIAHSQTWTVPCFYTAEEKRDSVNVETTPVDQAYPGQPEVAEFEFSHERRLVLIYRAMLTCVMVLLLALAVTAIASLAVWLVKLLLPLCRPAMGLPSGTCLDMVFLVSMAWANASPAVAMETARLGCSSPRPDSDGKEGEALEIN